jgi:hypothetical protein
MTEVSRESEARAQTVLGAYLREKKMYGFFELKICTGINHFSFAKIEPHQYEGLQATSKSGLVWKLSDQDMRQKPCDCLSIPPLPSYIVIKFKDGFYMVNINEIVRMREAGAIAITKEQAEKVAEKIIKINNKYEKENIYSED